MTQSVDAIVTEIDKRISEIDGALALAQVFLDGGLLDGAKNMEDIFVKTAEAGMVRAELMGLKDGLLYVERLTVPENGSLWDILNQKG